MNSRMFLMHNPMNMFASVSKTKNTVDTYEITTPLHSQILRVARSFGDFRFKWAVDTGTVACTDEKNKPNDVSNDATAAPALTKGCRALPPPEQAVTCVPEIITRRRSKRYACLTHIMCHDSIVNTKDLCPQL